MGWRSARRARKKRKEKFQQDLLAQDATKMLHMRCHTRVIHKLCTVPCSELEELLVSKPELLLLKNMQGKNGLHLLCCQSASNNFIASLFGKLPAKFIQQIINSTCNYGYTPVFYAVAKGHLYTAQYLQMQGANMNHVSYGAVSLYHLAATNLSMLKFVAQYTNKELALASAKSCYGMSAVVYAGMRNCMDCLEFMLTKLQLPHVCNYRKAQYGILTSSIKSSTVAYLLKMKVPVQEQFIESLIDHRTCIDMIEQLVRNTLVHDSRIEFDKNVMMYNFSLSESCFKLLCKYVYTIPTDWHYEHWIKYNPPEFVLKEYIHCSATANLIPAYCKLPIRDITYMHHRICAYDMQSLMIRLSRIQPFKGNIKRLCYWNGRAWSSNFGAWDKIPYTVKLIDCTHFVGCNNIPRKFTSVKFEFYLITKSGINGCHVIRKSLSQHEQANAIKWILPQWHIFHNTRLCW